MNLEVAYMKSKREHESFKIELSEDGQYFTQSYDGVLVIQTLDAYRAKNPKVIKQTHGCEGEQDDACILARHIAGEKLRTIYGSSLDGKTYSKGKVDLAVSIRYSDDPERILGLYRKFPNIFTARGITEPMLFDWVTKKRDRYMELGKLINKPNPKRPRKCTVVMHEEIQKPEEDANWISRDGETIFLNAKNILVMKKPSNLELIDKNSLSRDKERDEEIEQLKKELENEQYKSLGLQYVLDKRNEQLNEERSRNKESNERIEQLSNQLELEKIKNAKLRTILSEKDNQINAERLYIGNLESDNKKLIYALGVSNGVDRAVGYFGGKMDKPSVLGIEGNKAYDYVRKHHKEIDSIISGVSQNYDFEDDNNPD